MAQTPISNFSLPELTQKLVDYGERPFRAKQIFKWIYQKNCVAFSAMSDISLSTRETLDTHFSLVPLQIVNRQDSNDGTFKFLLRLSDGLEIETVVMNHGDYRTLCLSTQVGCAMGCKFCLTGKMGLKRNLTPGEIVDQARNANILLQEMGEKPIRNIVYMGMGEPFHNYSNTLRSLYIFTEAAGFAFGGRRITISTSGLIPQIQQFAREEVRANLAISLNGTNQEMRKNLMPISQKYPVEKLIKVCHEYAQTTKQKITFEYILIDGVTDSVETARHLALLLKNVHAKVNLIPFNESSSFDFRRPSSDQIYRFQKVLLNNGVLATQRHSKGRDILAACGQLIVGKKKQGVLESHA